jgi:hypothetical protein
MEGGLVRERISDRWRHSIKGGIGLVGRRVRIRVVRVECCSISIRFITITGARPIVWLENNYNCCQTNTW